MIAIEGRREERRSCVVSSEEEQQQKDDFLICSFCRVSIGLPHTPAGLRRLGSRDRASQHERDNEIFATSSFQQLPYHTGNQQPATKNNKDLERTVRFRD